VTTTFVSEGDFDISVVVSDAFSSTAESVRLEVFPLGPNAGTTVPNILDASGANNPVDNLGIVVSTSQGGALNFDATTNGITVRASGDTYTYTIPEQTATDPDRPLTGAKFTSQGIRVVQLDAVIGGTAKRSRLMLPISVPETDPSNAKTDTRTNKGIKSYSVKGKLKMAKTSTVAVSDIIEVSSGLALTDMTTIEFGASSFRTKITVDTKGKVLSQTGSTHISKVKVTMPKLLDKTTRKTLLGATMTITFSMTGTGAELADSGLGEGGLASDGVGKVANPVKGTTFVRHL